MFSFVFLLCAVACAFCGVNPEWNEASAQAKAIHYTLGNCEYLLKESLLRFPEEKWEPLDEIPYGYTAVTYPDIGYELEPENKRRIIRQRKDCLRILDDSKEMRVEMEKFSSKIEDALRLCGAFAPANVWDKDARSVLNTVDGFCEEYLKWGPKYADHFTLGEWGIYQKWEGTKRVKTTPKFVGRPGQRKSNGCNKSVYYISLGEEERRSQPVHGDCSFFRSSYSKVYLHLFGVGAFLVLMLVCLILGCCVLKGREKKGKNMKKGTKEEEVACDIGIDDEEITSLMLKDGNQPVNPLAAANAENSKGIIFIYLLLVVLFRSINISCLEPNGSIRKVVSACINIFFFSTY